MIGVPLAHAAQVSLVENVVAIGAEDQHPPARTNHADHLIQHGGEVVILEMLQHAGIEGQVKLAIGQRQMAGIGGEGFQRQIQTHYKTGGPGPGLPASNPRP